MPVLRAHHLAIALGHGQHAHHHIFGDGNRVDPRAVGKRHPALRQQIKRQMIQPGIDRIEPLHPPRQPNRLYHRRLVIQIEPANLRLWRKRVHLFHRGVEPSVKPIGQAVFDQGTDKTGKYSDCHWLAPAAEL